MSASSLPEPRWSLPTRIAFRFAFTFFVLIYVPFPLTAVPQIDRWWSDALNKLLAAAAHALFGVTIAATHNGSGDRMIDWVRLAAIVAVNVIVTIVWSIVDRRRASYATLHRWFRIYIRFALAAAMITYGAYKVIPAQFVAPSLDRLLEPFGDQSPMGLLWNFMGASTPYTIFAGLGELIGGLLLANRRTTLLGALISAAVMLQVVMLNFSYDVPVKIYSSELLLTAIVLIAPDAERLLRFLLADTVPKSHAACRAAAILFAAYVTVLQFHAAWKDRREYDDDLLHPSPLAGIWNVDEMTIDGVVRPPLATDRTRWRRWMLEGKTETAIQTMDDSETRYWLTLDEKKKSIVLQRRGGSLTFGYEMPNLRTLLVQGALGGKKITATMHKDTQRAFLLQSRGFHWVNERPFNR